jgi:plastocyanin
MIALVFYTSQTLTVTTPSSVYVIIQKGAGENLNLGFDPAKISIVIGINNTVVWKNEDSNWHTAHSNIPEFNSGLIQPGASFTHTFLRAGVYPYHCDPHPWMTGVVTVKAASGTGMIVHWGPNLREPLLEPSTIIMSINPASCELARGQNMAVT